MCKFIVVILLMAIMLFPVKTVEIAMDIRMGIVELLADAGSDIAREIRDRGIIIENDYLQHKELD